MDSPTIRTLTPDDAVQLGECFRRCYGATYAVDVFYDPAALRAMIERGELRSVVAISPDGLLVGHTGLTARHAGARVTEAGNTVVDPDWRGHGVLGSLGAALADLCTQAGFAGYVHYPTTAHEVMQKRSVNNGGTETGLMLAHVPAETDYRNFARGAGRLAVTVVYQPFAPLPARAVWVPARYAQLLDTLYQRAQLQRELTAGNAAAHGHASITSHLQRRRQLLHIDVVHSGADLGEVVQAAMQAQPAAVTHVDIELTHADISAAVEQLWARGFVFSALLPEFAASDVLRLQHLAAVDDATFTPLLVNGAARELLALIRDDYQTRR